MRDYSGDLTDERLAQLERRIAAVYKQARDDLDKEAKDYFAKFQQRDDEMRRLVEAGEFSREEYKQWRLTQMGRGQRFEALRDEMAKRLTDANAVALSYVNDLTPGIYSLNRNYEAYRIEHTVGDCGFTLFDESTVRRMIVEEPDVMPYYPPERALRRGIDLAYGKDQITKRVTSGILRGLSPGKIANELMQGITGMSRESALRAARTGITAAQNAGRMDGYVAAQRIGIHIRRRWVATKAENTRDAHALADGQMVEGVDTPFDVGGEKLMFPGDTSQGASGWNIYNCRCGMRTVEKDGIEAEPRQMRVRNPVTGKNELVNEMTYQEWMEWKKSQYPSSIKLTREERRQQLARASDTFTVIPPMKGDAIKAQSIYKELQKSEVGKHAYDFITQNHIPVEINYSNDAEPGVRGYTFGHSIFVWARNTRTVKLTTETIIHEAAHVELGTGKRTQWEEAYCFAQEAKHMKNTLTYADLKNIIRTVKELYPDYNWR